MPLFPSVNSDNKSSSSDHSKPPSSSSSSSSSPIAESQTQLATRGGDNAIVTEPWTRIFPEAFGIRRTIEESPFRWCVRESFLWGVATGTMMGM
jgi:hypothetical protein